MRNLDELRKEIDKIDAQLLPLLTQRLGYAKQVAQYKHQAGLPVLNAVREKEILDRVGTAAGEFGGASKVIFSTIMDVSRALQHQMLGGGAELRKQIHAALQTTQEAAHPVIACQGVPGAYSSAAAQILFPGTQILFYEQFEDVFQAIQKGEADYGIIPVENSSAGSVHESYDLLIKYKFYIAAALELPITHCLLGIKGSRTEDIREVRSHPQGLLQCNEFIQKHKLTAISCSNTAVAAEAIAALNNPAVAAIASRQSADLYGLDILEEGIQTNQNNSTRFIAISKQMKIDRDADKISMFFSLPHTTGSLYSTLSRFAVRGLNLTKIESRPIQGSKFQYYFYLDFTGNVRDEETINLLCALHDELPAFSFLGNFPEYAPEYRKGSAGHQRMD